MPADAFSEEESFRGQPGREKGLGDAEIHQTAGMDGWVRKVHGAVIGRGRQIPCLQHSRPPVPLGAVLA